MAKKAAKDKILGVGDVAEMHGVDERTARLWCENELLPATKLRQRCWAILESDAKAFQPPVRGRKPLS